MTAIKQSDVNKAAWDACDTFRGTIDPAAYKDYILVFLFWKFLSDLWADERKAVKTHKLSQMLTEMLILPRIAALSGLQCCRKRRPDSWQKN